MAQYFCNDCMLAYAAKVQTETSFLFGPSYKVLPQCNVGMRLTYKGGTEENCENGYWYPESGNGQATICTAFRLRPEIANGSVQPISVRNPPDQSSGC